MAEYQLYCFAQSGNAYRVALMLNLIGADWQPVFVDFFVKGEPRTPDYRANINEMDAFGQTPLSISLAVLVQDIGARRLQIPRRYRKEVAETLLKLGATPLDKSGVIVVLQRTGDLELGREEKEKTQE